MLYSLDKIGIGVAALVIVSALTLASGEIEADSVADVLVERAWAAETGGPAVSPPVVDAVMWGEDLVLRRPQLRRPTGADATRQ